MRDPEQPETARRIKAALAYANVSRKAAAEAMSVSPSHLDRFTSKEPSYTPSWSQLWALAERCKLPPEWFSADLTRLAEIVTDGPLLTRRGTPRISGETGRRVEGRPPSPSGRPAPRSAPGKGSREGGLG